MKLFSQSQINKAIAVKIVLSFVFLSGCTITKEKIGLYEREKNISGITKTYTSENSVKVRYWTLAAMGRLENPEFLPYLLKGLEEEHWILREEAAHGLGELGNEMALPGLVRVLNDDSILVRMEATNAITKIGKKGNIAVLKTALYDADPNIRGKVAHVMGFLESDKTTLALLEAIDDPDAQVRQSVITALGRLEDKRAIRFLIDILKDSQWEVRKQAAISLGKIGEYEAVESLSHLMRSDPNKEVRRNSRLALDRISKKIAQNKCGRCHTYYEAITDRRPPDQWEKIARKMRQKNTEWISEKESKLIIDYLIHYESVYETLDEKANQKFFAKALPCHSTPDHFIN